MEPWIRQYGWFLIAGACIVFALRAESMKLDTVDHHSFRNVSSQNVIRTRQQLSHAAPKSPTDTQPPFIPPSPTSSQIVKSKSAKVDTEEKSPSDHVASLGLQDDSDTTQHSSMAEAKSPLIRAASFAREDSSNQTGGAWLSGKIEADSQPTHQSVIINPLHRARRPRQ